MLQPHPRLVQRPGTVHLDVRFLLGRPGADGVERIDEGEGDTAEVVAAARDDEAHLILGQATPVERLAHHGHEHLHLVARLLTPYRRRLGDGDDGDLTHHRCSEYAS